LGLLPYWLDFFQIEQPDLAFLAAGPRSSVYDTKWAALLAAGQTIFGVAASDSHENFLGSPARDGSRVDSHRRILRWVSNHLLVNSVSESEVRAALAAGRFWMVFEALGTPTSMDFYGLVNSTRFDVGTSTPFVNGNTTLVLNLPTLHSDSPQTLPAPTLRLVIEKVQNSSFVPVAESRNTSIQYSVSSAGIYRAAVYITPNHLKNFLTVDRNLASEEKLWVLTNPIYLP
jgi:hypothetical protein